MRSCGGGLNAFMYIFGMFLIASKLVPMITAPSVPPSTISMADGFRIAMGFEPSMVAPEVQADDGDDQADGGRGLHRSLSSWSWVGSAGGRA